MLLKMGYYNHDFFSLFSSALDKIIIQGYKALQLEYFFTSGPDEVKAWTIQVRKIYLLNLFPYRDDYFVQSLVMFFPVFWASANLYAADQGMSLLL